MAWNFQRLHKETFKVKSCKKWIPLWRWAKGFTKSFNGAILRKTLKRLLMWKAVLLEHIFCYLLFKNSPYSNFDGKAQITVRQLTKHLLQLKIDTINNNNINVRHLGGKGLHLNQSGSNLLSKNFVNAIEKFWKTKGCSDISNNSLVESEYPFRAESSSSSRRSNTSLAAGFLENLRGKNKNKK